MRRFDKLPLKPEAFSRRVSHLDTRAWGKTCVTINGRVSFPTRDQALHMNGSIVCIGCAVSTLPRIDIETTARDKMNQQEKLERNEECRSASLWCHI